MTTCLPTRSFLNLCVPKGMDALLSYGLAPSRDIVQLQTEANAQAEEAYARSTLRTLSYDEALEDAREALVGLTADLTGATERRSLGDMLMHGDRLRGLGILLIGLALVGMFVDSVLRV